MLKGRVFAFSICALLATTATAFAEGEEGGMPSETPTETPAPTTTATDDGGGDTGAYAWGIETTFPTGGDGAHANFLKASGKNWLDVGAGVDFTKLGDGDAVIGVDINFGYRMVKPMKGNLSPFLEPMVHFGISDFANAGDTMSIGVGALMGVRYEVMKQFTLGVGFGGFFSFSKVAAIPPATGSANAIAFHLVTSSITAGFMW